MILRFATALSAFSFVAVQAQEIFPEHETEDIKNLLDRIDDSTEEINEEKEYNTIGTCVYGETEKEPTLTEFDGEFEGLAPQ